MLDKSLKYLLVNKSLANALGKVPEEIIGKSIDEMYAPEIAVQFSNNINEIFETAKSMHIEEKMTARGQELFVSSSLNPVLDNMGRVRAVTGIVRDITERKKLETQLLQSQKMEAIGVLAGGIAHDFNNLLQSIIMGIAVAQARSHEENVKEILMQAENECLKAEELSNLLITFSKGGTPIIGKSSIADMLKKAVLLVLKGSSVNTEFIIPDDLWPVAIDEGQIRLSINQLVMNAREAMPSGGILKVQARNLESIAKEHVPLEEGKYVKVTFADNGAGISPENLSKIFDPYFTTKEMGNQKGMGLSLTVSQSIIKKHKGIITAESRPGTGATFHIYLPAALP